MTLPELCVASSRRGATPERVLAAPASDTGCTPNTSLRTTSQRLCTCKGDGALRGPWAADSLALEATAAWAPRSSAAAVHLEHANPGRAHPPWSGFVLVSHNAGKARWSLGHAWTDKTLHGDGQA